MVYNGNRYIYVKNGTDDITGILDSNGSLAARYEYDGYGNCTVYNLGNNTIGSINPYRYRSYYYDNESGLYYLNSRYYDSNTGRFISPDDVGYLGASGTIISYNLFSYCGNNPTNKIDNDGRFPVQLLTLADFWVIHKVIQIIICVSFGWLMEIYVKGKLGRGFLDIYNPYLDEYYEVKKENQANSTATKKQMEKYDVATIRKTKGNKVKGVKRFGISVSRGTIRIKGQFEYGIYVVKYKLHRNGLISYRCDINPIVIAATVTVLSIGAVLYGLSKLKAFSIPQLQGGGLRMAW